MAGAMQASALKITNLIDHAAREHATREIVSYWADGSTTRTNWGEIGHDFGRFGHQQSRAEAQRHRGAG